MATDRADVILEIVGHDDIFPTHYFTIVPLSRGLPIDRKLAFPATKDGSQWCPPLSGICLFTNVVLDPMDMVSISVINYMKLPPEGQILSAIGMPSTPYNGCYVFKVTATLDDGRTLNETRRSTYIDGGQTNNTNTLGGGVDLSASGKIGIANVTGKANFSDKNVSQTTGPRMVERIDTTNRSEGSSNAIKRINAEGRPHVESFSYLAPSILSRRTGVG